MGQQDSCLYAFGPFRVDPLKRVLCRDGETLPLTSRAFDTLLTLVQNAGSTVAKEEIIERVWGDTIVEENNLTQCVSALRKALGEGPGSHQFIATVPRTGYRFVATVVVVRADADNQPPAISTQNPASAAREGVNTGSLVQNSKSKIKNRMWLAAAVLALSAAGIFWLAKSRLGHPNPLVHETAQPETGGGRTMMAVLPFENLTGDPAEENFTDGLTEEIITQLGRSYAGHLGIIAHTSVMRYKRSDENVREIARELGVAYLMEGSVRRADGEARISVQLIRASDQTELWAQSYERPLTNVLGLEADVAGDIQSAIARRLGFASAPPHAAPGTASSAAYEAYLTGLYFFHRRDRADLLKAVASFQQAVRTDPRYALAFAGLADAYTLLALDEAQPQDIAARAKAASIRAVDLDGSLAESRAALGATRAVFDWDWPGARREFLRALAANPNNALAHHWYAAFVLAPVGRFSEAVAEIKAAQRLDPVSLIVNTDLGWAYFISGRDHAALVQYRKTVDLDPNFLPVHFRLSQYYLAKKMYPDWVTEIAKDERLSGHPNEADAVQVAYHRAGYQSALKTLSRFEARQEPSESSSRLGEAYENALLGQNDRAIRVLAEMCGRHDPGLLYLKVDPAFAKLRPDRKFRAIEHQMGLAP